MSKLVYVSAVLLLAPAPALAQIVVQDPVASSTSVKPKAPPTTDLDKVECRMQDTIGSRLQAHKVCLTKQQWWQAEQDEKRKVEELQDLTPVRPSGI